LTLSFTCERTRDAEVGHQCVSPGEQNILRLYVAMDDLPAVGIIQRLGHLPCDPDGLLDRQLKIPAQALAQGLALDERHGKPEHPARPCHCVHLTGVVHRQDVGMLKPGGQPDLPQESLGPKRSGQIGVEHLERNQAVVLQVMRQIHHGHAPVAELALDGVAVVQGRLQPMLQIIQGGSLALGQPAWAARTRSRPRTRPDRARRDRAHPGKTRLDGEWCLPLR
jgi:hypothetical protein